MIQPLLFENETLVYCEDTCDEQPKADCYEDSNGNWYSDKDLLVECDDTGNTLPKADCIESEDGLFYESFDELQTCDSCDKVFHNNDCREEWCDSCYDECHSDCNSCGDSVHHDDEVCTDHGDSYCSDCYSDTFTSCDGCSCEITREEATRRDDSEYCEGCAPEEEWDQTRSWRGCAEHDKVGSPRKFGIELETSECSGYEDWARNTGWGAKEDGSIPNDGKEFVSAPMYGNDGYDDVLNFCRKMESNYAEVNDDCGYHLHIDMTDESDESLESIGLAYHYTREFWYSCVDNERRNYTYCRESRWDRSDFNEMGFLRYPADRWTWLNWRAHRNHNTVEVRNHHATTDGYEVMCWVKAHLKFVDYVKGMSKTEIQRRFGNQDIKMIMREMRIIWKDCVLSDYYGSKVSA